MARDAKKRQKRLQKKNAKRKQKRADITRQTVATAAPSLSRTTEWPLDAVWINGNWREPEQLIQMLFIRRGPHGHIAMGRVLVDTMCLGVKSAFGRVVGEVEYKKNLEHMNGSQGAISADPNLLAKIIRESVAYAGELGFKPDKDLRKALIVLGATNPDACTDVIPLGGPEGDGKPCFVAGPYDNVDKIIATLTKKFGPDGFTFIASMESMGGGMLLDPDDFDNLEFIKANPDEDVVVLDADDFQSAE